MWTSRSPRAGRARTIAAAMLLVGAVALAGCTSVIDSIPTAVGGLPEGVPQRPTTPQAFPAVHDMPPARSQATLNAEERDKLKEELAVTRERAARHAVDSDEATASVPKEKSAAKPKNTAKKASNPSATSPASGTARTP